MNRHFEVVCFKIWQKLWIFSKVVGVFILVTIFAEMNLSCRMATNRVALKCKFHIRNNCEQLSIMVSRLHSSQIQTSWFKYYRLDFAGAWCQSRMQILIHYDDGFRIFCNTYPDCVHGQLFKKWDKTLSIPQTWPELTVYGSFHSFPHKDFIAFFKIVFPGKCRFTENIGIYLWLVNRNERQTATRKPRIPRHRDGGAELRVGGMR